MTRFYLLAGIPRLATFGLLSIEPHRMTKNLKHDQKLKESAISLRKSLFTTFTS